MKRITLLLVAAVVLTAGSLLLIRNQQSVRIESESTSVQSSLSRLENLSDRSVVTLLVNEDPLQVEVVKTAESITLGLSGRSEIGRDGMLFILPTQRIATFWMKDMLFDLDMIWIDEDKIISITADVSAPPALTASQSAPKLPTYSSIVPVTHVLEVPAGTAREKNWQIGAPVVITR